MVSVRGVASGALLVVLLVLAMGADRQSRDAAIERARIELDHLAFDDSLRSFLGPIETVKFGKGANAVSGVIKNNWTNCDTTTGREMGWRARARTRVLGVDVMSKDTGAPNCSTYVFADQDTLFKLAWNGSASFSQDADLDSSAHWIAPGNIIVTAGQVVSMYVVPNATSADNPDHPVHQLYVAREEVP